MTTGPGRRSARWITERANELALVAVLCGIVLAVTLSFSTRVSGDRPIDALAVVLLVIGPLALPARHADPAWPVAAAVLAASVYVFCGYWLGPVLLAVALSLVIAELAGRTVPARTGAVVIMAVLIGCLAGDVGSPLNAPQVFGICGWIAVVVAIAAAFRTRSEVSRQRRERQAEEARRVASEGRLQLARDLHDVLAHSLSVINVQAGVALHLLDDDPGQARTALEIVKATSRETLGEIRGAVETLRSDGSGTGVAPRTATIGLHDLDRLVASTRPSGLDTTVSITGEPRPLPPRIDIAAYRILQESLTNITKHSDARSANVTVDYATDAVVLTVDDPGPARANGGRPGHGLNGMRERATDLGGQVTAGRRLDGGFAVRAEIPTGAPA